MGAPNMVAFTRARARAGTRTHRHTCWFVSQSGFRGTPKRGTLKGKQAHLPCGPLFGPGAFKEAACSCFFPGEVRSAHLCLGLHRAQLLLEAGQWRVQRRETLAAGIFPGPSNSFQVKIWPLKGSGAEGPSELWCNLLGC